MKELKSRLSDPELWKKIILRAHASEGDIWVKFNTRELKKGDCYSTVHPVFYPLQLGERRGNPTNACGAP
jgi:hypothetical protein